MKKRTSGHTETTISGDTRAHWSEAFALVPSLEAAYCSHASKFTREVLDGLLRIGFLHHQQSSGTKAGRCSHVRIIGFSMSRVGTSERKMHRGSAKPGRTPPSGHRHLRNSSMDGSDEQAFDHPTQKPIELMRRPILNLLRRGELVYEPFLGSGTTLTAAELTERVCYGIELDPKYARNNLQVAIAECQGSDARRRRTHVRAVEG
jgi:hypothetical protein